MEHLDGASFRTLAERHGLGVGTIYGKVSKYLKSLPHCADITREYCSRFCGILEVDGKYVKVKGFERKIPAIYGIDYLTHDIPTYIFSEAENYQTLLSFFSSLRLLNYPLQALVCDENTNIFEACKYVYPQAKLQLCQNHYKENIRHTLDLNLNKQYLSFMRKIEDLFSFKRNPFDFERCAKLILKEYEADSLCVSIMASIYKNEHLLLGWRGGKHIPITTNLIESFNSHLQGRLETIKGFENFNHADLWLNGYFLRRREKKFTGCEGKFRGLNGYNSISKVRKPNVDIPPFFNEKRARF